MFKLIDQQPTNRIASLADGFSQIGLNRLTRLNKTWRLPIVHEGVTRTIEELEKDTKYLFSFDVVCTGANRSVLFAFDVKDELVTAVRVYNARFGRLLEKSYVSDGFFTFVTLNDDYEPRIRDYIVNNVNYLIELNLNQYSFNSFFSQIILMFSSIIDKEKNSWDGASAVCWNDTERKQVPAEPHSGEFYDWLRRLATA